jgi:flagellar biosynthesis protein FlhB
VPDQSSKTEKPTKHRIKKSREEGQFLSSRELVAAAQFVVFVVVVVFATQSWFHTLESESRVLIERAFGGELDITAMTAMSRAMLWRLFAPLAAGGLLLVAGSLVTQFATTKLGFTLTRLTPDVKRFNPVTKFRDLASQAPLSVLQALLMLVLFAGAIYSIAKDNSGSFFRLPFASLNTGLQVVSQSLTQLLWKAAALFIVFGLVDLLRQRRRLMKQLKMTKQELKEEHKESEGNPLIKGRIRRIQRDLARKRMMKEVPTATAVVVNPTHFAVALKYSHESMSTPIVVAKGKNYLALRIRALATEHNVPIIENPPLAQALYKAVDVGQEIPPHLYRAVAEILAYIYRLMHQRV